MKIFRKNSIWPKQSIPSKSQPISSFLGEIPRLNDFEGQTTAFEFENGEDDFVPDDAALAAVIKNELVVITGCSHSGICIICEQAKKVTGISKIKAEIGGFHLKFKKRKNQRNHWLFQKKQR